MTTMQSSINRLMLGFVAVFVLGVGAVFAYQTVYVIPAKRCEAAGQWWEPETRVCATPVYIPHITGRPANTQAAAAAAAAALPEAELRSPKPVIDARPDF